MMDMAGTQRGRWVWRYTLFGGLLAMLAVFLLWPIALTVAGGFTDADGAFTLKYFTGEGLGVLRDPLYLKGLLTSLMIAVGTTALSLGISMPMAVVAAKYRFAGKGIITSLVLVPLILPPFVGAIGFRALLGRFGALNSLLHGIGLIGANQPGVDFLGGGFLPPGLSATLGPVGDGRFWSVLLMQSLHLYPILYLNLTAALANLDPSLDEAARNLGAGRVRRFFRVTLPLIMPGLFAGATIVFIWAFTELGTPLMFDYYQVTPVQVFWGLQEISDNPRPYALVVVMLVAAVVLYGIGKFAFGGRGHAMQGKATAATDLPRLTGFPAIAALGLFLLVTFLAVLPHLGVILASFTADGAWYRTVLPHQLTLGHYGSALTHELALASIRNSLIYSILAMVLSVAMGLAIAYLTVRVKVRGGWILDTLGMLPLAVPGLVLAFGYVAMTLSWPMPQLASFFHGIGMDRAASLLQVRGAAPNPLLFLVIAYTVRKLPYILRSAAAGLEQTSGELEEAALNLGAPPRTAIRRVVVPLIAANLIAGGILVFAFAMLEVSDSLILAQKQQYYPITKAIWELFNRLGDGPYIASAMGVWGMALLTITLVGASILMGKKLGAIFRV